MNEITHNELTHFRITPQTQRAKTRTTFKINRKISKKTQPSQRPFGQQIRIDPVYKCASTDRKSAPSEIVDQRALNHKMKI